MASKERVGNPPWRSPDHPPYALMIREAITSLSDPRGATSSAISDYIISNFDGLPPAHARLFPFFLTKLTHTEDISEPSPGRFIVPNTQNDLQFPEHNIETNQALRSVNPQSKRNTAKRQKMAKPSKRDLLEHNIERNEDLRSVNPQSKRKKAKSQKMAKPSKEIPTPPLFSISVSRGESMERRGDRGSKKRDEKLDLGLSLAEWMKEVDAKPPAGERRGGARKKMISVSSGN